MIWKENTVLPDNITKPQKNIKANGIQIYHQNTSFPSNPFSSEFFQKLKNPEISNPDPKKATNSLYESIERFYTKQK